MGKQETHLVGKSHGSRSLERPRYLNENNIIVDLKEVCVFHGRNWLISESYYEFLNGGAETSTGLTINVLIVC
jgi:hypothetical protein